MLTMHYCKGWGSLVHTFQNNVAVGLKVAPLVVTTTSKHVLVGAGKVQVVLLTATVYANNNLCLCFLVDALKCIDAVFRHKLVEVAITKYWHVAQVTHALVEVQHQLVLLVPRVATTTERIAVALHCHFVTVVDTGEAKHCVLQVNLFHI